MSRHEILWSPTLEDTFLTYGSSLQLFQAVSTDDIPSEDSKYYYFEKILRN